MKHFLRLATLALACGLASAPAAAGALPQDSLVTARISGPASGLFSADDGYALAANPAQARIGAELEFLSDDITIGIDFEADGVLRLWDNSGTGLWAGATTLVFDFDAHEHLVAADADDLSALTGGALDVRITGPRQLTVSWADLQFASPLFESFSLRLNAVHSPATATLALLALGLLVHGQRGARRPGA